jgi:hypothetical protein
MGGDVEVELKAGTRLRSAVSDTEVIVIKPPSDPVELSCGGRPMMSASEQSQVSADQAPDDEVTMIGKRYEHEASGLVVLCTKGGNGSLCVGDTRLTLEVSRALPSSD